MAKWTEEDSSHLETGIEIHGWGKWQKISRDKKLKLGHRSPAKIRDYVRRNRKELSHLDPNVNASNEIVQSSSEFDDSEDDDMTQIMPRTYEPNESVSQMTDSCDTGNNQYGDKSIRSPDLSLSSPSVHQSCSNTWKDIERRLRVLEYYVGVSLRSKSTKSLLAQMDLDLQKESLKHRRQLCFDSPSPAQHARHLELNRNESDSLPVDCTELEDSPTTGISFTVSGNVSTQLDKPIQDHGTRLSRVGSWGSEYSK